MVESARLSLMFLLLLIDLETSMDALLYKVLSWKMMVAVVLLNLIWKESSSSMRSFLPVVSTVEEFLNSVWLFLKDLAGTSPITAMLNLISSEKDKVAISLLKNVAAADPYSMNFALEVTEVVLLKEDLAVNVQVTPRLTDADMLTPIKIGIATMMMLLIMLDSPIWKPTEEDRMPSVSLVPSIPESQATVPPVSASNTSVSDQVLMPNFKFYLKVVMQLLVLKKDRYLLMVTMVLLIALTHLPSVTLSEFNTAQETA